MLKYILVIFFMTFACGQENDKGEDGKDGDSCTVDQGDSSATISCPDGSKGTVNDGKPGSNGNNGTNGKDAPVDVIGLFGFWTLPDGGYLEILETSDKRALFNGTQRIYSKNFNGSLALFPAFTSPNYVRSKKLNIEMSLAYAAGNGLNIDGTNTLITGTRKTTVIMENVNEKLKIRILVYSSTGLVVECDRTVLSE